MHKKMILKRQVLWLVGILLYGVFVESTDKRLRVYGLDTLKQKYLYHTILSFLDLNFLELAQVNKAMNHNMHQIDQFYYEAVTRTFLDPILFDPSFPTAEYYLTNDFRPIENEHQFFVIQFKYYLGRALKQAIILKHHDDDVSGLKFYYFLFISRELPIEIKHLFTSKLTKLQYLWLNHPQYYFKEYEIGQIKSIRGDSFVYNFQTKKMNVRFLYPEVHIDLCFERKNIQLPLFFVCKNPDTNEIKQIFCLFQVDSIYKELTFFTKDNEIYKISFKCNEAFAATYKITYEDLYPQKVNVEPWFDFSDFVTVKTNEEKKNKNL